jgi:hypothetical protein
MGLYKTRFMLLLECKFAHCHLLRIPLGRSARMQCKSSVSLMFSLTRPLGYSIAFLRLSQLREVQLLLNDLAIEKERFFLGE